MAETIWWNMLLIHSMKEREVLTITGCSIRMYLISTTIGIKIQGKLTSFAVFALMPSLCLLGFLKHLIQMSAQPVRFQELYLFDQ